MQKRGILALDIDGTLTDQNHTIANDIQEFLTKCSFSWNIYLVTGRAVSFAKQAIQDFSFPYMLAAQNGADILHMPDEQHVKSFYLDLSIIDKLDRLYTNIADDYVVYAGYEAGDFCYYRKKNFSEKALRYLQEIQKHSSIQWKDVKTFSNIQNKVPLIKCFGQKEDMLRICQTFDKNPNIQTFMIKDVIDRGQYLVLINAVQADKGKAIRFLKKHLHHTGPVIAAGDDANDTPLLLEANIRIVVDSAPKHLHGLADVISTPANGKGIVKALTKAIELADERYKS